MNLWLLLYNRSGSTKPTECVAENKEKGERWRTAERRCLGAWSGFMVLQFPDLFAPFRF